MDFSIVTPSFRQPEWLRLCLLSVSDQARGCYSPDSRGREEGELQVEHVVQDACSGEDVRRLCAEFPLVRLYQERDAGMYDAVNRGLRRTSGAICAYLNCDEQYLPGALRAVRDYFLRNPEIDVVFGDVVVIDEEGRYICSRQVVRPTPLHTQLCQLNTFTAAMFFRRTVLTREGLFFDDRWRNVGDVVWVLNALRRGVRVGVMRRYLAAFVDTGANLNLSGESDEEKRNLRQAAPSWARQLTPVWLSLYRIRRLFHGLYWPCPFEYEVYAASERQEQRIKFEVTSPTPFWRSRWSPRQALQ